MPRTTLCKGAHIVALLVCSMLASRGATAATIRLAVPERENIQYLTLWVAVGADYFRSEGLDVELVVADAPNQAGRLLLDKHADIALLQPPIFLGLMGQQQPIVLFANLLANDPINLVVRPDVATRLHLDPHAPLADRLKALRGLRIGVANEPPRRLRVLFAAAGMDADHDIDMRIIPAEGQITAFTVGAVDALYTHTPYLEDAIVAHGAVLLINQSAGEVAPLGGGQIHSLATTREFADVHPEVVAAVTRAIARAERLLHSDPEASAQALVNAGIPQPTQQHISTIVSIYRMAVPETPRVSVAAVERDALLYPSRPAPPDFTKVKASDFLMPEFAEDAATSRSVSPVFDLGVVNVTAPGTNVGPIVDTLERTAIENHDTLTVDRAIEYLPGVSVDHKAPRNQTGISISGFDTRQVPLYLDGIPAYVPFDGYVDLTRYLTSDVSQIQVAKGYTSPLLGPNVLGGVINLVTRQPQKSLEGEAIVGTGAGNLLRGGMHVGMRHRRAFLQGSADRLQSDFYPVSGAFALNAIQPGTHRVNVAQRDSGYRLRVGWTPRAQDSYVFSYSSQRGMSGVPPYAGSAPACPPGATLTTPCVTPKYWKWPEWNTDSYYFNSSTAIGASSTTQLRAFSVRYANTLDMFDDASYSTMTVNAASGSSTNRDHTLGVSGEFESRAIGRNAFGASFFVKEDDHVEQTTTFSRTNVGTTTPAQTDRDQQSSFGVHDAFSVTSHIRATAGFSADHLNGLEAQDLNLDRTSVAPFQVPGLCAASGSGFTGCTNHVWTYNPVASISYTGAHAGSLVVAYAHKSRFPTIKDRYSYKAGRAVPNPLLKPERAQTWTVGYSRAFAFQTVAQIDVFRSNVRDEIENIFFLSPLCPGPTPGGGGGGGGGGGRAPAGTCQQAMNVGAETHEGVTLAVRTTPHVRVTVDGHYSFLHREISGTPGVFPAGTPTHKAVASATLLLPFDATAMLSARHQDGILAMSDNGLPLPAASFTVVDLGGRMEIRRGLQVQAGLKNLFDRNYYYWEGFPEEGRSGYLTLRFVF
jgi:iron complex outermembrane recepter protein